MALSPSQGKKPLTVRRGCKRSRLESQLLAAAYELLTPISKRPLPTPQSELEPKNGRAQTHAPRSRRAGGNQA
jgi:hypothetical protein